MTTATTTTDERIKQAMRSSMPSPLVYAQQADDEIQDLKLYFNILDDIFAGDSTDSEKLRKIEYLVNEFERSFECWAELAGSVLETVARMPKDEVQKMDDSK